MFIQDLLEPLKEMRDWTQKGERGFDGLVDWIDLKRLPDDQIEAVVDSMKSTQSKTLRGYDDYCSAFKTRWRLLYKGYKSNRDQYGRMF